MDPVTLLVSPIPWHGPPLSAAMIDSCDLLFDPQGVIDTTGFDVNADPEPVIVTDDDSDDGDDDPDGTDVYKPGAD